VVLLGRPNVGKSSLLNALARRDAAIVTAEPGTTRDPIEVRLDLGGMAVTIVDTAGIGEAARGGIEAEGMRRARERAEAADLVLALEAPDVAALAVADLPTAIEIWRIVAKADLAAGEEDGETGSGSRERFSVSAATGAGLGALEAALAERFAGGSADAGGLGPTRARHRAELDGAVTGLRRAATGVDLPMELRAEELRSASERLARLTGEIGVEDLLDAIFAEFCIGK
jgi:tRNA modification GTPase